MTPEATPASPPANRPAEPITVDDLRRKAYSIRDLAQDEAREIIDTQATRIVVAGVVAVAVAISVAYYLGSRRGRRRAAAPPPTGT